jgi:hypothetical protein
VYSEKTPDNGQRNCPKHAEFYSKNIFEKLVHLVDFIISDKNLLQSLITNSLGSIVDRYHSTVIHIKLL